jgi:L-aspartate oxidase
MRADTFHPDEIRSAEVLIVGGGVAGLTAAVHARGRDVLLVGKTTFAKGGSSVLAQGGVAAALGDDDSPVRHAQDTAAAGAGLCHTEVVRKMTSDGPRRICELLLRGAKFDRQRDGRLALGREAAHSRNRIVHAAGDATGAELVSVLAGAAREARHISRDDHTLALELVLDRGAVVGVMATSRGGRRILYSSSEVVLATGGIGWLWSHTTNPAEATGDGLAMALRAGARVADLEFMQFHPTALALGGSPMPLLTEALRGDGAVLIDETGGRFMLDEHPQAELAPRDVVARAVWRLLRGGGSVYLDARSLADRITTRFPTVVDACLDHGLDIATQPVPVAPAAHYHMGGVMVDVQGRTSLPGLWAVGEVARTGLHGANRLASNSLLEALVIGAATGEALASSCRPPAHPVRVREAAGRMSARVAEYPWLDQAPPEVSETMAATRSLMWRVVGLQRDAAGLHRADLDLLNLSDTVQLDAGEFANGLLVAQTVARAARARTESRGAHFRSDFPRPSGCWRQPIVFDGVRMLRPHPVISAASSGG